MYILYERPSFTLYQERIALPCVYASWIVAIHVMISSRHDVLGIMLLPNLNDTSGIAEFTYCPYTIQNAFVFVCFYYTNLYFWLLNLRYDSCG